MAKLDGREPQNWIPRELFASYVGPDSDDLLAYYDKAKAQNNPLLLSFNLLALLVLPAWLGLRQQWAIWATFTGLIGVIPFVQHAFGVELPLSVFGSVSVAIGAMARGFLLTGATGRYLKLKRKGLTDGAIREALEGKARSNIPFAIAGGFGSLTVIVGLTHLAQILTGQLGPR